MADKLVLSFAFERETKGAVRWQEVEVDAKGTVTPVAGGEHVIGSLYFRKDKYNPPKGEVLTLTIEPA